MSRGHAFSKAASLISNGRYAEAISLLVKLIDDSPAGQELNCLAALAYKRSGALSKSDDASRGVISSPFSTPELRFKSYSNLSCLKYIQGDFTAALHNAHLAFESVGDDKYIANHLSNSAAILTAQGRLDEAERSLEKAIALSRESGNPRSLLRAQLALAYVTGLAGDPVRGLEILDSVKSPDDPKSMQFEFVCAQTYRGTLYLQMAQRLKELSADLPEGLDALDIACRKKMAGQDGLQNLKDFIAAAQASGGIMGHLIGAVTCLDSAIRIAASQGMHGAGAQPCRTLAEVYLEMGDIPDAVHYASRAYKIAQRLNELYEVGIIHGVHGRIARVQGDENRASISFNLAKKVLARIGAKYELDRVRKILGERVEV